MEKKYHLTDDGPKPCTASVRDCPVGGEHFSSVEDAWKSYDKKQESKLFPKVIKKSKKEPMSDDKIAKIVVGTVAGVLTVGTLGGMVLSTHNASNTHDQWTAQANKTPYSISVTQHGERYHHNYTAQLTDSNLKQTNFDNCVSSTPKKMDTTITCKTSDGKYSIKVDVNYTNKQRDFSVKGTDLNIKDGSSNQQMNNFKTNQLNNITIFIPNNIIK